MTNKRELALYASSHFAYITYITFVAAVALLGVRHPNTLTQTKSPDPNKPNGPSAQSPHLENLTGQRRRAELRLLRLFFAYLKLAH